MTKSLVVSVTDELVAELEKEARLCESDTSMFMDPALISALLAERAELKRDAKRWRKAREILEVRMIEFSQKQFVEYGLPPSEAESLRVDAAIDAAMHPEASQ